MVSTIYQDKTWVGKEEKPSDLVPTTLADNLEFRRDILAWSHGSAEGRQLLTDACARDPLFFCNAFIWALDVKRFPNTPDRPVILWPKQVEIYLDMHAAVGRRSIALLKSRDNGGTLIPLIVFDHFLHYGHKTSMLIMSRNELLVDNPKDPDSLFSKLEYFHSFQPSWMTDSLVKSNLAYVNTKNKSNIIGASTTSDALRGGRKHAAFIDEYAAFERKVSIEVLGSLEHATKCRLYVSTPKGIGNGFHQVVSNGNIKVQKLSWQQHPIHRAGLYTSEGGRLKVLDKSFWRWAKVNDILRLYPEMERKLEPCDNLAYTRYPWILDGKIRSPYYDHACLVCGVPRLIAAELDMDFVGSGSLFYDVDMLREYVTLFSKEPMHIGELTYEPGDEDSIKFSEQKTGRMFLWFHPDVKGRPPEDHTYSIGVDISTGSGVSNSRISIGDNTMRCLCASFTTPHMRPERLAEYVDAVGRWFNNAKVVFEGTGLGYDFGCRIRELNYPNLYWFKKKSGHDSDKPGWFSNEDLKRNLLTEYGNALASRLFTNPDGTAVRECELYEWTENQQVVHSEARSSALSDPAGAKKNHGDRVIGDALCWMLVKKYVVSTEDEIIPDRSMARRIKDAENRENTNSSWWKSSRRPPGWGKKRW